MNKNIKQAFDGIRAEERLKMEALSSMQSRIRQGAQKNYRVPFVRTAVAFIFLLAITFIGVFYYRIYFTEAMYVDMDINPSIELTLNRFNRVIGVYAYNEDGEKLLTRLDLMHKPYESAVTLLAQTAIEEGFLQDGGLVSVTLQSSGVSGEDTILNALRANIAFAAQGCHASVQIDAFSVDGETRENAHGQNLTPAKYLAILELQAVDPAATVEGCRNHSIGEIRELTEQHGGAHHGHGSGYETVTDEEAYQGEESDMPQSSTSPQSFQGNGRHGNGHHGNGHE